MYNVFHQATKHAHPIIPLTMHLLKFLFLEILYIPT